MTSKQPSQPGPATEAATQWLSADSVGHLRLEELAVPLPEPGELRLRLTACAVCPVEAAAWAAHRLRPGPLGQLAVGEIESLGSALAASSGGGSWRLGQRVFASARSGCGSCRLCRADQHVQCSAGRKLGLLPGAIGHRATVVEPVVSTGLLALPSAVSDAAATLIEPLASVERAWTRAGLAAESAGAARPMRTQLGTVLVMGLGLTGQLHAAVAAARGASLVIAADRVPHRLAVARRVVAAVADSTRADSGRAELIRTETVNVETEDLAERVRTLTGGAGADVVVVGPGSQPAMELGSACVGVGGTLILFSPLPGQQRWPMPVAELFFREVRVVTSFSAGRPNRAAALADLAGPLATVGELLITHRLPLRQYELGFRLAAESAEALQVVLLP